ncbi:MAG: hypothetical protein HYW04_02580, partial [Deltaproteobacteria bacterium]|nr:hypothetical protein [Deltaproteobacteria bacterium]
MEEKIEKLDESLLPKIETHADWLQTQKIPVVRGFFVEDIKSVELAPWDLKGGLGAIVILDGTGGVNDGYICEIPPGGKLKPQK